MSGPLQPCGGGPIARWTGPTRLVIVRRENADPGPPRSRSMRAARSQPMKLFFLRLFTWWNGATLNTLFYTRQRGELVGRDEFGNEYYQTRGGAIDPALGFVRRWVIYNGVAEASMTPPGWNGWLHHTVDTPPTKEDYRPREWELPH